MPGMLDTVLNVGCTSAAVHGLVRMTGHPRFAWDCRRRFLESYASVVLGIDAGAICRRGSPTLIAAEGVDSEQALDGEALERLAASYQQMIEDEDCVRVRRSDGTARSRGASGLSLMDERSRPHLSPA